VTSPVTGLPSALAPWAPALGALDAEVALGLGPVIRRIDELLSTVDAIAGGRGEPEGYDGLSTRGTPERLVASEWLLATELPMEFLRRAATGELLYLARGYRRGPSRGRVAVLVDTGPEQLGAGRLVQLAALVVLHRRAARQDAPLVVGALGDEPGRWRAGEFAMLLDGWLHARRSADATTADVDAWTACADDELWVLTGPRLAGALGVRARRRVLVSAEADWDADGATAIELALDGRRVRLPLPARPLAVRTLRGAGFRRGHEVVAATGTGALRAPVFPSASPNLLARGERDDRLARLPVAAGRPRWHSLSGPVLAAGLPGRRLVALVVRDDQLRIDIAGKQLRWAERIAVPLGAVRLSDDDVSRLVDNTPVPLYLNGDTIAVALAGQWWQLPADAPPIPMNVVAAGPGPAPDAPRLVRRHGDRLYMPGYRGTRLPADTRTVLGPGDSTALSPDGLAWDIRAGGDPIPVTVKPGDEVLGIVLLPGGPALVTVSSTRITVRLVGVGGPRTLTACSGPHGPVALHPTQPWLAVPRSPSRIDVVNLATGTVLRRFEEEG
jgi:hypothetical protein